MIEIATQIPEVNEPNLDLLDEETILAMARAKALERVRDKEKFTHYQQDPEKRYEKQILFHRSLKRSRWIFGGERSGKTTPAAVDIISWMIGEYPDYLSEMGLTPPFRPPIEVWAVSLDFNSSREIVQPKIREWLPKRYIRKWTATPGNYALELTNGSTCQFKSCESGWEKFQGVAKHLIWFDEEPDWAVYRQCLARLIDYKGYIIGSMTPTHGMTYIFDEVYEPWMDKSDPDIDVITLDTYDNPYLDKFEIERIEKKYDGDEKEARMHGKFVEFAGLIYKGFDRGIHVIPGKNFPIPKTWTRIMCIDPGINNPTACLWIAISPDDVWYVYDEYYETDKTVEENAKAIKAITGGQKILATLIDPAADARTPDQLQSVRQQYMKYGIFTRPANNDVSTGINAVKQLLRINEKTGKPRLFFLDHCVATIKEIARYRWGQFKVNSEGKNLKEKPQKVLDHAMDALRYLAVEEFKYQRDIDISKLGGYKKTSRFTGY